MLVDGLEARRASRDRDVGVTEMEVGHAPGLGESWPIERRGGLSGSRGEGDGAAGREGFIA